MDQAMKEASAIFSYERLTIYRNRLQYCCFQGLQSVEKWFLMQLPFMITVKILLLASHESMGKETMKLGSSNANNWKVRVRAVADAIRF